MRKYICEGVAEFQCEGLHKLTKGRHHDDLPKVSAKMARERKLPIGTHLTDEGEIFNGEGHHHFVVGWNVGGTHVDDHTPSFWPTCDEGCTVYHLVRGIDPRTAPSLESEEWDRWKAGIQEKENG